MVYPEILSRYIDPIDQKTVWVMLDEKHQVFLPIQQFLSVFSTTRSPNTVRAYGLDLKMWFEFLTSKSLDWQEIKVSDLEDFAYWLRIGDTSKVVSMQPVEAQRCEKTVNRAITAVTQFYDYHIANKSVDSKRFDRFYMPYGINRGGNKGLLTGIAKARPIKKKLVKLKEVKKFPGCLTDEQVETLVDACNRIRDKLMILMLNATGIRKGELLCLQHEDIGDFGENYIYVVDRGNQHPQGARVKGSYRTIPVDQALLKLYDRYLIEEFPSESFEECPYVFVNCFGGDIGKPMNPDVINTMFTRLSKKTGIRVYPHLFRHTYATRLLRANYQPDRVKHLLGHSSIQTTLDVYSHVINEASLRKVIEREAQEE